MSPHYKKCHLDKVTELSAYDCRKWLLVRYVTLSVYLTVTIPKNGWQSFTWNLVWPQTSNSLSLELQIGFRLNFGLEDVVVKLVSDITDTGAASQFWRFWPTPIFVYLGVQETEHCTVFNYLQQIKLHNSGLCDYYSETETVVQR